MRGFEILLMVQKTGKCHWFSECCFSVLGTMESFPLSSYYIEGLFFFFCLLVYQDQCISYMFSASVIWCMWLRAGSCSWTAVSMQTLADL